MGKYEMYHLQKFLLLQFFVRDNFRTKIICMLKASQRIHISCTEMLCVRKVGGPQHMKSYALDILQNHSVIMANTLMGPVRIHQSVVRTNFCRLAQSFSG